MSVVEAKWTGSWYLNPLNHAVDIKTVIGYLDIKPFLEAKKAGRGILRRAHIKITLVVEELRVGGAARIWIKYGTKKGEDKILYANEYFWITSTGRFVLVDTDLDVDNEFVPGIQGFYQLIGESDLIPFVTGKGYFEYYMWYSFT